MSKRMMCSLVAILVLALPVSGVWAAEMLPEGVTMVVLKESPASHLPGVAKVRLVELRIAPDAKWMNYTIPDSGFCTVLQGTSISIQRSSATVPGSNHLMASVLDT